MKFTEIMLGGLTPMLFGAYWLYALIGMIFHLIVDILKRKKDKAPSPYKWDWAYYWADNKQRLILSFACLPLAVVFGKYLTGEVMNIYLAFTAGYLADNFVDVLKQRKFIKNCDLSNRDEKV